MLVLAVVGCSKRSQSSDPTAHLRVAPEYQQSWNDLLGARDADPEQIEAFAQKILAQDPPLELQVATLHILAERAYALGDDERVVKLLDDAIARQRSASDPGIKVRPGLVQSVQRLRAFALVRGGDANLGLSAIEDLAVRGLLTEIEVWGSRAVAHDRRGTLPAATLAFLEWRSRLEDDTADAVYAEDRFSALAARLTREELTALAREARGSGVRACLRARTGDLSERGVDTPSWTDACRVLPGRMGVLLPRSGRYKVLADRHFAAATAAIRVLAREREVAVLWRDAGSTPESAREGVHSLIRDGAQVIIGPVGTQNIRAAAEVAGADLTLVVPGAGVGTAIGVAPRLEARIAALVALGAEHKQPPIVLAPDNPYGRQVATVLAHVRSVSRQPNLQLVLYPPGTTSFKETLDPILPQVRRGALVIVADAMARVELLIRQLRREGIEASESSVRGAVVASTGEGFGRARVQSARAVFEGVIFAPAAWPSADSARFEEEFRDQQDAEPDEQALLLWRAFERVWRSGDAIGDPPVGTVQIRDGKIVEIKE